MSSYNSAKFHPNFGYFYIQKAHTYAAININNNDNERLLIK